MKTKWKSKILKSTNVYGKIILKWISNLAAYEGGLGYGKNMGKFFLPLERL
jgi:hypothetical protein